METAHRRHFCPAVTFLLMGLRFLDSDYTRMSTSGDPDWQFFCVIVSRLALSSPELWSEQPRSSLSPQGERPLIPRGSVSFEAAKQRQKCHGAGALFVAQRLHGLDGRGPSRGDEGGDQSNGW